MQKKWNGILQILNEKVRLLILISTYLLFLRIAILFKMENPYMLLLVYFLSPFIGVGFVALVYDKIVTSLKRKQR
jgi:hypothetical protein